MRPKTNNINLQIHLVLLSSLIHSGGNTGQRDRVPSQHAARHRHLHPRHWFPRFSKKVPTLFVNPKFGFFIIPYLNKPSKRLGTGYPVKATGFCIRNQPRPFTGDFISSRISGKIYGRTSIYWVVHRLPQIYTANHATFPIQIRKITVKICGYFWVTQYSRPDTEFDIRVDILSKPIRYRFLSGLGRLRRTGTVWWTSGSAGSCSWPALQRRYVAVLFSRSSIFKVVLLNIFLFS